MKALLKERPLDEKELSRQFQFQYGFDFLKSRPKILSLFREEIESRTVYQLPLHNNYKKAVIPVQPDCEVIFYVFVVF
jgi:hypothetical protein